MAEASSIHIAQPPGIWVGCSGWAYPSWRPDFYPAKTPQKKLLEAYGRRLNSVEVNYTFRTLPTEAILEGWMRATPERFRFSFKAPQRITHFSRLRKCGVLIQQFHKSLAPVEAAGRLGVILLQLPPNFAADVVLLDEFLSEAFEMTRASAGTAGAEGITLRLAFEFRHSSWFADAAYTTLKKHGAGLCVAESDELQTPDVETAPFACYRLRRSQYPKDVLDSFRETLKRRATGGDVFAYFKHEEEPQGPLRAAAVLEGLDG